MWLGTRVSGKLYNGGREEVSVQRCRGGMGCGSVSGIDREGEGTCEGVQRMERGGSWVELLVTMLITMLITTVCHVQVK